MEKDNSTIFNFKLENIGSISTADFKIKSNTLNIKFALNGVGKTTIAKALYTINPKISDDEKRNLISLLTNYSDGSPEPKINNDNGYNNIYYFDDSYVNNFLFKKDKIIKDSIEILFDSKNIKDSRKNLFKKIEQEIQELKKVATSQLYKESYFQEIYKLFKTKIKQKDIKNIDKINEKIKLPGQLIMFNNFFNLGADYKINWMNWFIEGVDKYKKIDSQHCAFCGNDYEYFDNNITKDWNYDLYSFFKTKDDDYDVDNLDLIKIDDNINKTTLKNKPNEIVNNYKNLKENINKTYEKFQEIVKLELFNILEEKNGKNLEDEIRSKIEKYKLDLNFLEFLSDSSKSNDLKGDFKKFNEIISEIINDIDTLKKAVIETNKELSNNLKKWKMYINEFLINTGIPYYIEFVKNDNTIKLFPKDISSNKNINLSYGERNSISLILFAVYSFSKYKDGDLIIIDDPISSFDDVKKFAILYFLFSNNYKNSNLFNKTVLLLTHDFGIVYNFLKKDILENNKNQISFLHKDLLENNIIEINLEKKNLITKIEEYDLNMKDSKKDIIVRLLYLRNKLEFFNDKKDLFNFISAIFHLKDKNDIENTYKESINQIIEEIKNQLGIEEFEYDKILDKLTENDFEFIRQKIVNGDNIEKICFSRIWIDYKKLKDKKNSVLWDYLSSFFHTSDTYMYTINKNNVSLIPNYIFDLINNIK